MPGNQVEANSKFPEVLNLINEIICGFDRIKTVSDQLSLTCSQSEESNLTQNASEVRFCQYEMLFVPILSRVDIEKAKIVKMM